ncbi:hypothetical protein Goari_001327, partial [Gossypium aridum]|nr:hypothetical protein [Gossypium aridum]
MEAIPEQYKHMIEGPSVKVDTHTGAFAEGVLTFAITFIVLLIMLRGPQSEIFKTWFLSIVIVTLVTFGSAYTGPSMNPAFHEYAHFSFPRFLLILRASKIISPYVSDVGRELLHSASLAGQSRTVVTEIWPYGQRFDQCYLDLDTRARYHPDDTSYSIKFYANVFLCAFGWAYVHNQHDKWDHFYVYWICPFIGATLAGWVFRQFFSLPPVK